MNLSAILLVGGFGITNRAEAQVRLSAADQMDLLQLKEQRLNQPAKVNSNNGVVTDQNSVGVLLTLRDGVTVEELEANGMVIEGRIGNHIYGKVPILSVEDVAASNGVIAFSLDRVLQLKNDTARKCSHVDEVQAGTELLNAYNGEGVIVSLTDVGLDPNHITFKDDEGKTRVKRLWQYNDNAELEASCTEEDISEYTTDDSSATHGTHVLGTITGSCTSIFGGLDWHGMAPKSDIAVVCGSLNSSSLLSGVKNIIDYANEVGKPVVINMSVGYNSGPHDGSDTFTAALNELAKDTPIFVAAGNEGASPVAVTGTFTEGNGNTIKTILETTDSGKYLAINGTQVSDSFQGYGAIEVWSDDATPVNVYFDIVSDSDPSAPLYTLEVTESGAYSDYSMQDGFSEYYSIGYLRGYKGVVAMNGRYYASLGVCLEPKSDANCHVALRVEGEQGHRVFIYNGNEYLAFTDNGFDGYTNYTADGSISNIACGENTICVGAYISYPYFTGDVQDAVCDFSSWGVLCDGRELPDLVAPGSVLFSSSNNYNGGSMASTTETADGGTRTDYWAGMAGTSMATPVVTGVGALLLCADPNLTPSEIKNILVETATEYEQPSVSGGAGMLNALAAVKIAEYKYTSVGNVISTPRHEIIVSALGNNCWDVFASAESALQVSVSSVSGAVVKRENVSGNAILDLNGLPSGIYIVSIGGEKSMKSVKLSVR